MTRIPFNPQKPDLEALRQIIFERLRRNSSWNQLHPRGTGYSAYVEYEGGESSSAMDKLAFYVLQVFWQLVTEGVLAPGTSGQSPELPWFHVTNTARQLFGQGLLTRMTQQATSNA